MHVRGFVESLRRFFAIDIDLTAVLISTFYFFSEKIFARNLAVRWPRFARSRLGLSKFSLVWRGHWHGSTRGHKKIAGDLNLQLFFYDRIFKTRLDTRAAINDDTFRG